MRSTPDSQQESKVAPAVVSLASGRNRLCVACRKSRPQADLIRLTLGHSSRQIGITFGPSSRILSPDQGRSAYLCPANSCIEQALKGTRLKLALEGRKRKDKPHCRNAPWPLEAQIIQKLASLCAEAPKTCQNTQRKEGSA